MGTVFALVLTYNRIDMLEKCLKAITSQTRPCDVILVIDNCSTDATADYLASNWADKARCYSLSKNIGAAGGFSAGLRLAFQQGADHIWVMDDDVIVEPGALEAMLVADEALERSQTPRSYLVSTVFSLEGEVTNVPTIERRRNKDGYERWPEQLQHGLIPINRAAFTSILLPRRQLEQHGLPIRQMFIWGDDTDYTMRITKDTPGYIVGASRAVHARVSAGPIDIATENNKTRIGYHRLRVRNEMYVGRKHYSLLRTTARHLLTAAKLVAAGKFAKAGIIVRAFSMASDLVR